MITESFALFHNGPAIFGEAIASFLASAPSLKRPKHFQNPQQARLAMISFNTAMTGASRVPQSTRALYNVDRDKPTIWQALAFDSLCSSVMMPTAIRFSIDVTTFGLERP